MRIAKWAKELGIRTHYYISLKYGLGKKIGLSTSNAISIKCMLFYHSKKDSMKINIFCGICRSPLIDAIHNQAIVDNHFKEENQKNPLPYFLVAESRK
jgi:lipid-A-disaccharide synthase